MRPSTSQRYSSWISSLTSPRQLRFGLRNSSSWVYRGRVDTAFVETAPRALELRSVLWVLIVLQLDIRLSYARQTKRELHPGWTAKHSLIKPDIDITPTMFSRIVMQKTSKRRWQRVVTGVVERRTFKSLPMRANSTKPIQPDSVSSLVSCSEGTAARRKHSRDRMLAGTYATDVFTERPCQLRVTRTCDLLFGQGFYISLSPTSVLRLKRGKFLHPTTIPSSSSVCKPQHILVPGLADLIVQPYEPGFHGPSRSSSSN